MKIQIRYAFTAFFILLGIFQLQSCKKVYDDLEEKSQWSTSYIPVQQNGAQVGLIAMHQKVITDMDRSLDTESKIAFTLQNDQNNSIWQEPNAQLLIQVFDPAPGWNSSITHEIVVNAQGCCIKDTLSTFSSGFSRPFLPEQIKVAFLKCNNGNVLGGRYNGVADGKKQEFVNDSVVHSEHLFICSTNAIVSADGWIEVRFVNFPDILGLSGRVINGTFNGQLYLPSDSVHINVTHFPKNSLNSFALQLDSGITSFDSLNRIYLSFEPR